MHSSIFMSPIQSIRISRTILIKNNSDSRSDVEEVGKRRRGRGDRQTVKRTGRRKEDKGT